MIHRTPRGNYKLLLVCIKLDFVNTTNRTMVTVLKVTIVNLPMENLTFESLMTHYHRISWWKWWIFHITIIKPNFAPFSKKTESASIAKNAATPTVKKSWENHMTICHHKLRTQNRTEWTAFKNQNLINWMIKTIMLITIINHPNWEL